ncbi:hypothetical protein [Alkalihalobacillus deserti]|uniref:hypothetical protein n=1 Tax=Alkalihalobacillus deserti TaxID=2879466 RepID=UPI001D1408AC|nr:hypothetical protein [Alkalihalobacillus deserti]
MFTQWVHSSLGFLCFFTSILYITNVFFPSNLITVTYNILAAILLLCAILSIEKSNKVIVLTLLILGTYFFSIEQADSKTILYSLGNNFNLISIFLLVPLLGIAISVGGYLSALKEVILEYEKKGNRNPHRMGFILTICMTFVLNLGTIPIVNRIAEKSFSNYYEKKLGLITLRAFGFSQLWSPYFVNVGLVLVLLDISWKNIALTSVILAVIYLLLCEIFNKYIFFQDDKKINPNQPNVQHVRNESDSSKKIYSLIIFFTVLLSTSFLLDYSLSVNMLPIITVLALFYPVFWSILIGEVKEFYYSAIEHISLSFQWLKNEIAIFISAGYFAVSLTGTNFGELVSNLVNFLSFGSVYILTLIIVILSIVLSLIGVHPVIIVTGIGGSLSPSFLGISSEYMAVVLLIAWVLSAQLSPFSGAVLITSRIINASPLEVAKKNTLLVITSLLVLTLTLQICRFLKFI